MHLDVAGVSLVVNKLKLNHINIMKMGPLVHEIVQSFEQREDKIDNDQIQDGAANKRRIALVAHNNMKQAMLDFVRKYQTFFDQIHIVTTKSTGLSIENGLGIKIRKKVSSGPLGGDQEIGAMVTNDMIAGVIFFVDPLTPHPHQDNVRAMMRICDVHNCPIATNPMSGEALLLFMLSRHLKNTFPSWRDMRCFTLPYR